MADSWPNAHVPHADAAKPNGIYPFPRDNFRQAEFSETAVCLPPASSTLSERETGTKRRQ